MKILPNKINKFFDSILSKLSVPKKDRNLLIKSLLDSSIRGVDSHGIRLFSHYVKCIENGRIKAKPKMIIFFCEMVPKSVLTTIFVILL